MPLFISDEELRLLGSDTAAVAERGETAIRELRCQVDAVRVEADAATITVEQTCALLEQRYASLFPEFNRSQAELAELTTTAERRAAELASSRAEIHQLHIQAIAKDGDVERLKVEISKVHKSKCQSLELIELRDAEMKEKDGFIQS